MEKYIVTLDEGTTSARTLVVNKAGKIVSIDQKEFKQFYPNNGWVEQDPIEIWNTQRTTLQAAINKAEITADQVEAIGITNQRETVIIWDKDTGNPIYNAIVWQDRRTDEYCASISKENREKIRKKTGLIVDAYFSATKIKWILDNVANARKLAEEGKLYFGNINTWLIWRLSGGETFVTDHTNASRTMLYNIETKTWDDEILEMFNIPKTMLPEIKSNSEVYGKTFVNLISKDTDHQIPIASSIGDQQSALFGQGCFDSGELKTTYGTGSFIIMNTGDKKIESENGLLTVVSYSYNDKFVYGLEGSVMIAGAGLQWLRDEIKIIDNTPLSEWYAKQVNDDRRVYVVPSFSGLGSPYWDPYSRGAIFGLDRGTTKEHIIKGTLESIAYQVNDVIDAMNKDSQIDIKSIRVDGGASNNNYLMQFQSNITDSLILRPENTETTAMGAAYLAGLAVGYWKDLSEIKTMIKADKEFKPESNFDRTKLIKGWKTAVNRTKNWLNEI